MVHGWKRSLHRVVGKGRCYLRVSQERLPWRWQMMIWGLKDDVLHSHRILGLHICQAVSVPKRGVSQEIGEEVVVQREGVDSCLHWMEQLAISADAFCLVTVAGCRTVRKKRQVPQMGSEVTAVAAAWVWVSAMDMVRGVLCGVHTKGWAV